MPVQPTVTYMVMYPYNNDPNGSKPPMLFMIPMLCIDQRNLPNGMAMPTMPPMPNIQFPFFAFPTYGMNMNMNMQQNK